MTLGPRHVLARVGRCHATVCAAALILLAVSIDAAAQNLDGYASVLMDVLPRVQQPAAALPGGDPDDARVLELRARLFGEHRLDAGERFRLTTAGFVEGLLADRGQPASTRSAIVRPQEVHAEVLWPAGDLRVGFSRVVWGRLDEFQPTDVVNPLDLARFFFEGRSEARLPVTMIRGRLFPSDRLSFEAIYVPVFRRGRFDQLDEATSPFNLAPAVPRVSHEPALTLRNGQGGARVNVTTGRVDWAVSAYRGFEPLPVYELGLPALVERFPRFTMLGADFETVRGAWGIRGEVAAFVDRTLQAVDRPIAAEGRTVEGGVGVDRHAGRYRVSTNVLFAARDASGGVPIDGGDFSVVASVDRSFARETRHVRGFAVYNPGEASAFARIIASFSLRDDVTLEASGGWFTGEGTDAISRFASRDFLYARLKVFF